MITNNPNTFPLVNIPEEVVAAEKLLSNWMVMHNVEAFGGLVKRSKYDKISENYYELLYAVSSKYENETRHQTALRYIKEMEQLDYCDTAKEYKDPFRFGMP